MPDDFLSQHNLELTGQPYTAEYISIPENDLPPGCKLPPDVSLPPLVPVAIDLPPQICTVILPPVPPPFPYFCIPAVSGGVSIISPPPQETKKYHLTGNIGVIKADDPSCDYIFGDSITLDGPCVPDVEVNIDIINPTGPNKYNLSNFPPASFDEATCTWKIDGPFELAGPCVPSVDSDYHITTHSLSSGSGPTVTVDDYGPSFTFDEATCQYALVGSLDIGINCIPYYTGILGEASIELPNINPGGINSPIGYVTATVLPVVSSSGCDRTISLTVVLGGSLSGGGQPEYVCNTAYAEYPADAKTTMELDTISVNELNFDNSCCNNTVASWSDCGRILTVAEKGQPNTAIINATGDFVFLEIEQVDVGQIILNTQNIADSNAPAEGDSTHIKIREVQYTDGDGDTKRALFVVGGPWDPEDEEDTDGIIVIGGGGSGDNVCDAAFGATIDGGSVSFCPSTVNGVLLATNYRSSFTLSGGTSYVYLEINTDGNVPTSFSIIIGGSNPPAVAPTKNTAPLIVYVLLYVMVQNDDSYDVLRTFPPQGLVTLRQFEAYRTDVIDPDPGTLPYEIWYGWSVGNS